MVWSDDGDGDGIDSIASVAVSVSRAGVYLRGHLDVEYFVVFGVDGGESLAVSDVAPSIHRRAQTPHAVVLPVSSPSNCLLRLLLIRDCVLMVGEHFPWV